MIWWLALTSKRGAQPFKREQLEFMSLPQRVKLVEVGPRDGLQNEKSLVPAAVKIELVHRLQAAGLKEIEVYAYNPFNYLVRFFFFSRKLKNAAAKLFLSLERSLNRLSGNRFSKRFGYMIFGVGRK